MSPYPPPQPCVRYSKELYNAATEKGVDPTLLAVWRRKSRGFVLSMMATQTPSQEPDTAYCRLTAGGTGTLLIPLLFMIRTLTQVLALIRSAVILKSVLPLRMPWIITMGATVEPQRRSPSGRSQATSSPMTFLFLGINNVSRTIKLYVQTATVRSQDRIARRLCAINRNDSRNGGDPRYVLPFASSWRDALHRLRHPYGLRRRQHFGSGRNQAC